MHYKKNAECSVVGDDEKKAASPPRMHQGCKYERVDKIDEKVNCDA